MVASVEAAANEGVGFGDGADFDAVRGEGGGGCQFVGQPNAFAQGGQVIGMAEVSGIDEGGGGWVSGGQREMAAAAGGEQGGREGEAVMTGGFEADGGEIERQEMELQVSDEGTGFGAVGGPGSGARVMIFVECAGGEGVEQADGRLTPKREGHAGMVLQILADFR